MKDIEIWKDIQLKLIETKLTGISDLHKKAYGYDFISEAIKKVTTRPQTDDQMEVFKSKTETLISLLPDSLERQKAEQKTYQSALAEYKNFLKKEYDMVGKGYFLSMWMPLGIAIGLSFGVALKNIALGIPIGIAIGVALGTALNKKAEKEGRVI